MSEHAALVQRPNIAAKPPSPLLQLKCACQSTASAGSGGCAQCQEDEQRVAQAKAAGTTPANTGQFNQPASIDRALASPGLTLTLPVRRRLEPDFGHDFSQLRIHDDSTSHQAARSLGAQAFTLGQHIYFGAGRYAPHTETGLRLLAHEVTHTLQQRGAALAPSAAKTEAGAAFRTDRADAPLEQEADAAAAALLAGQRPRVSVGGAAALGGAANTQALLQRKGDDKSVERKLGANEKIQITRSVVQRPCRNRAQTRSTPKSKIFYWDENANAVGFRFQVCRGRVQLDSGTQVDYDDVVKAAEGLVKQVQSNPTGGSAALQDAINSATVGAKGQVSLTVDRTLNLEITGESSAGTETQSARVQGKLIISPSGSISFVITGGVGFTREQVQESLERFASAELGLGPVSLQGRISDTRITPAGGDPSSQQRVEGTLRIPISGGTGVEITGSRDSEGDTRVTIGIGGTFGKPKRPRKVRCYCCDCPPPEPSYNCTRIVDPHEEKVVDRPGDRQLFRLMHLYDRTTPADAAQFKSKINNIVGLVDKDSHIESIHGYASPEGKADYNQALGEKRANFTRERLSQALSDAKVSTALPAAVGSGELLGESSTRSGEEARSSELVAELSARLRDLSDDERLDLLGVPVAQRTDPAQRAQALADIQAFIDGREGRRRLTRRARWEKIFPFLRRTEVWVNIHEQSHQKKVPGNRKSQGCSKDDIAYAEANMKALPKTPGKAALASCESPDHECEKEKSK